MRRGIELAPRAAAADGEALPGRLVRVRVRVGVGARVRVRVRARLPGASSQLDARRSNLKVPLSPTWLGLGVRARVRVRVRVRHGLGVGVGEGLEPLSPTAQSPRLSVAAQ
jgi:hypothetical protein